MSNIMIIPAISICVVFVAAGMLPPIQAATSVPSARIGVAPAVPDDTVLLAAVIAAVQEGRESMVRIDPRPLRAGTNEVSLSAETLADVPDSVTQARSRVLARLGVAETDALRDARCPGPFVGILAPERLATCPDEAGRFFSVVLALPRPGGAAYPYGGVAPDPQDVGRDLLTVRVIERFVTEEGAPVTVSDYVAERSGTGWTVIKKRGVLAVD